MKRKKTGYCIRLKVWIENEDGELVFSTGRIEMLQAIDRTGSINKAAKELSMSYRDLWGRITKTENRLGIKLLLRSHGGAKGGVSMLTPVAKKLMQQFCSLHKKIENESKKIFRPFCEKNLV